jgi:hypothetical protein
MTGPDLPAEDVIDALDSFYCHNVVAGLWADAVANRLAGPAIYLLSDELPEVAGHARAAAGRLAGRIGDLGGAVTGDPGGGSRVDNGAVPADGQNRTALVIPHRHQAADAIDPA